MIISKSEGLDSTLNLRFSSTSIGLGENIFSWKYSSNVGILKNMNKLNPWEFYCESEFI